MWVIDFESSGLSHRSYPIEVGITNGTLEYHSLIRPMDHWQFWSEEAQLVHGLSKPSLLANGALASEVANNLNARLENLEVYCDCVAWDSYWANALFSDNGIHQRFRLLDCAQLLDSDAKMEKFLEEKARLITGGRYQLHRALDDAKILWHCLAHALDN